jgi:N-acetylneuraminic acid mutarotase
VNKKIYVIGGSFGGPNDILSVVEEYDPAKDIWTKKADMPTKRFFGPSISVVRGKIYAIGGAAGYDVLSTVEVFDPVADTWESLPDMPNPRAGSACLLKGKIYYVGGALTVKPPHPAVSTVEVFTPSR